ncbi:unnamed protein product, partial [Didymodactylos carnosus]
PKWLHVYLSSPKQMLEQCIFLAEQNSFKAIVVTCDRIRSIYRPTFIQAVDRKQDKILEELLVTPHDGSKLLKDNQILDERTPDENLTWKKFQCNHGGRQVDTGLPAIECLKDIVDFVNGRCEIFIDSGIRTGTDILKCLALGAKGVLIGRPILYGLA